MNVVVVCLLVVLVAIGAWAASRDCWHIWGKWETVQFEAVTVQLGVEVGKREIDGQQRQCRTCGLMQRRQI